MKNTDSLGEADNYFSDEVASKLNILFSQQLWIIYKLPHERLEGDMLEVVEEYMRMNWDLLEKEENEVKSDSVWIDTTKELFRDNFFSIV